MQVADFDGYTCLYKPGSGLWFLYSTGNDTWVLWNALEDPNSNGLAYRMGYDTQEGQYRLAAGALDGTLTFNP